MKNILEITKDRILSISKKVGTCRTFGIYFLINQGEIVYIGQSNSCQIRISTHAYEGKKIFDRCAIFPVKGPQLDLVEWKLIEKHLPKYNLDCLTCSTKGIPRPRRAKPEGARSPLAKPVVTPLGYFSTLRSAACAHKISHQAIADKINRQVSGWGHFSESDNPIVPRVLKKPGRKPKA